jgi:PilZ domain
MRPALVRSNIRAQMGAQQSLTLRPERRCRHWPFGYELNAKLISGHVRKLPMGNKDKGTKTRSAPDRKEKRGTARHGVLRQGKISFDGRTVYCAVRDFSAIGAKLQVGVDVPEIFNLAVVGHDGDLRAECKWRKGEYVGVVFQEQLDSNEVEAVKRRYRLAPQTR